VQMIDLDPNDGIAPSLEFTSTLGNSVLMAGALQQFPYSYDQQTHQGLSPWEPASISTTVGVAHVAATIAGSGTVSSTTFSTSGSSGDFQSPNYFDYVTYSGSASAPGLNFFNTFTLSANTALIITGVASITATGTGGLAPNVQYGYNDYARAGVTLAINGPNVGGGSQSASAFLNYSAEADFGSPFDHSDSRTLAVSFVNASASSLSGNLKVQTDIFGWTYATVVPEPASAALLLAGLAGLAARRRR